jgi:c-di-GMP-binding flagellar brake protein YcgR
MLQSSSETGKERRRSARQSVEHTMQYRVSGSEDMAGARVLDLSAGGLKFLAHAPLQSGTSLAATLRSATAELVIAAFVVRCVQTDHGYEIGCAFD